MSGQSKILLSCRTLSGIQVFHDAEIILYSLFYTLRHEAFY
jgi:hypothetical protein